MTRFRTIMRAAVVVVVLVAVGGAAWLAMPHAKPAPVPAPVSAPDTLFGTVELRRMDLAFDAEGVVTGMARHQGDAVHPGELVAELDDASFVVERELAVAQRDAAKARLDLLLQGTRPEEINRARANVANVQAAATRAEAVFARQEDLFHRNVASQQAYDDALTARDSARAALAQYQAVLAEAIAGPRSQEIEVARAELRAAEAAARLAGARETRTKLYSPVDGVVMARVIEPGAVVRPGEAVYSVAIAGEVWVNAFVSQTLLGHLAANAEVRITGDNGHAWRGRIGTVFPVAEFSSMPSGSPAQPVYRVRIVVENPDAALGQGMAVTITLPAVAGA